MRNALMVDDATGWFVQAHHPDMRRMPGPAPGRVVSDRTCAALAWNSFRTLALIDPSFWLRHLHARLFGFDGRYRPPETLDVRLWVPLPRTEREAPREITIDILLESEHTCWGLLAAFDTDIVSSANEATAPDHVVQAIDALTWRAGARDAFLAFICSDPRSAVVTMSLMQRYAASPQLLQNRITRANACRNLQGIGTGTWRTIAAVLDDCLRHASLDTPERQALLRCRGWFGAVAASRDVQGESTCDM